MPGTSTSTGNIPARSPPVASEASRAPARQRHTDGRAAWNGRSLVAAAPPGASAGWSPASNLAPRPLISTTTPSSGGPPEQPNALQGAYHPHYQDYQGGLHSNAPPRSGLTGCCLFAHCAHFFLQRLNSRYARIHHRDVGQLITRFRRTSKWSSSPAKPQRPRAGHWWDSWPACGCCWTS